MHLRVLVGGPEVNKGRVSQGLGLVNPDDPCGRVALIGEHDVLKKLGIGFNGEERVHPALHPDPHPVDFCVAVSCRQPGGVIGFPSKIVRTIEDDGKVFVLGKGLDVELGLGEIEIGPLMIFGNIHGDVDGPVGASHVPVGHVGEGGNEHAPLGLDFESFLRRNDHRTFKRFWCQAHCQTPFCVVFALVSLMVLLFFLTRIFGLRYETAIIMTSCPDEIRISKFMPNPLKPETLKQLFVFTRFNTY